MTDKRKVVIIIDDVLAYLRQQSEPVAAFEIAEGMGLRILAVRSSLYELLRGQRAHVVPVKRGKVKTAYVAGPAPEQPVKSAPSPADEWLAAMQRAAAENGSLFGSRRRS